MATIREVCKLKYKVDISLQCYGATREWIDEYERLMANLGYAIASELTVRATQSDSYYMDIVLSDRELGPIAQGYYNILREFIKDTSYRVSTSPL